MIVKTLKDTPLYNIGGDFVFFDYKAGGIRVPYIIEAHNLNLDVNSIVSFVVVKDYIAICYQDKAIVYDTVNKTYSEYITTSPIVDVIPAGDLICFATSGSIVFYDGSAFKEVTLTFNGVTKTIAGFKQVTPFSFVFVTLQPTTLYIDSITVLADIYNSTTGSYDYTNSAYASYTFPTKNIDVYVSDFNVAISGDDGSVFMTIEAGDLVYIRTQQTYNYRRNFYEVIKGNLKGLDGVTLEWAKYGLIKFKSNTGQVYYANTSIDFVYLSQKVTLFSFEWLYDPETRKLYRVSFVQENKILQPINAVFQVKHELPEISTLKYMNIIHKEYIVKSYNLELVAKYLNSERGYNYNLDVMRNMYKFNVKGDGFLYNFMFDFPVTIGGIEFGYSYKVKNNG